MTYDKKLALILFGLSYKVIRHWTGKTYFVDYKNSVDNYKKFIFQYFQNLGYEIDVFFCTNDDIPEEEKTRLIECYKPVNYTYSNELRNVKVFKAIECCINSGKEYDNYLITRFDLEFKIPFNETCFDINKFNMVSILETSRVICDNFYFMNKEMFSKFHTIIKNTTVGKHHHRIEPLINQSIGPINFIKNERRLVRNLTFYKIVRTFA